MSATPKLDLDIRNGLLDEAFETAISIFVEIRRLRGVSETPESGEISRLVQANGMLENVAVLLGVE